MKIGDIVKWHCVNGIADGIVEEQFDDKSWWVRMQNGRYMLLKDDNIIKEEKK